MRRWIKKWWPFLLVATIIVGIIGWKESRCERQAQQCRAYYSSQSSSVLSLGVNKSASEQQAINATCEPNSYFCRLFSAANLPAMLLVFIGVGAVWAAIRTLRAIREQTEATQIAAKAAKANAIAALEANRATRSEKRARLQIAVKDFSLPKNPSDPVVRVNVIFSGQTDAFIEVSHANAYIANSLTGAGSIPEIGGNLVTFPMQIPEQITPTTRIPEQNYLIHPDFFLDQQTLEKLKDGTIFLHFYAFIIYRDVYDKRWKRTFRRMLQTSIVPTIRDCWVTVGPTYDNAEIEITDEDYVSHDENPN